MYRVPVGQGQYHIQSLRNRKGEPNHHPKAGQPYDTASEADLIGLMGNPVICEKAEAYWMLASAYNGHDARTFGVQEQKGEFVYLLGDVDEGDKSLTEIRAAVSAVLPGTRALINSTSSAKEDDKRWHITVPTTVAMPYQAFAAYQRVFFTELEKHGLKMDWALTRSAQLFYLPSKVTPDSFYQWAEMPGEPYAAGGAGCLCAEAQRVFDLARAEKLRHESASKRGTVVDLHSIIGWVNSNTTTEDLLLLYGYSFNGREWASPYQQSSSARHSTMVRQDGSWFSLSDSDNVEGLGQPARGGRNGDAFDLICHFAFHNDRPKTIEWANHERRKAEAKDPVMLHVKRWAESFGGGRNG